MFSQDQLKWLPQVEGVIFSGHNQEILDRVRQLGVPAVNISALLESTTFPSVVADNAAVGRMAADHLLELGLRHLAVDALRGRRHMNWVRRRAEAFIATAEAAGVPVSLFGLADDPQSTSRGYSHIEWLKQLPKPVGILACNDTIALATMDDCYSAGLSIPDEVAVIGVDDDAFVSRLAPLPLTSISIDFERAGYIAGQMLDDLLDGASTVADILIPPRGVRARASTDLHAIGDPVISQALRFIREQAHRPISVRDVVRDAPLSRRAMELRFTRVMRRSILDEIHRVKVERAKRLLADTDLKVSAIAHACGFASGTRFGIVFNQVTGQSPSHWRSTLSKPGY
jgi:LacI family transcriptional regulator